MKREKGREEEGESEIGRQGETARTEHFNTFCGGRSHLILGDQVAE